MGILIRFVVTFVAVFAAGLILPASMFRIDSLAGAAVFAIVLAALNAFVKPIVLLLTCPIQMLTLGLSTLLINALVFLVAAQATSLFGGGVQVGGFVGALVAAIVVSIISWVASRFVP